MASGGPAIIVTGSDSRYFPLLEGLIRSLGTEPATHGVALGVLDCGLTESERAWLEACGAQITTPGHDINFADGLAFMCTHRGIAGSMFQHPSRFA